MTGDANVRRFCGFLTFFVLVVFVSLSFAQPVAKEACLACHGIQGMQKSRAGQAISLHVDAARFGNSVHGAFNA
jgi:hypothetical protein